MIRNIYANFIQLKKYTIDLFPVEKIWPEVLNNLFIFIFY